MTITSTLAEKIYLPSERWDLIRVNTNEMVLVCATVNVKGKLTTEVRGVQMAVG